MHRLRSIALGFTILSACGSGPHGGDAPDARGVDAPPAVDADGHNISVLVYDDRMPSQPGVGLPVVFAKPDGTVTAVTMTGPDGRASGTISAGDSVTTMVGTNTWTILDVQPGDDLPIGLRRRAVNATGAFHVTAPAWPGTWNYAAIVPCNMDPIEATPSLSIPVLPDCAATTDLVVLASDVHGVATAFIEAHGVPFAAGGSYALAGPWTPVAPFTVSYQGIDPAAIHRITTSVENELNVGAGFQVQPAAATVDVATWSIPGADPFVQTEMEGFGNAAARQWVVDPIAAGSATYALDLGTGLLPWLHAPTYDLAAARVAVTDAQPAAGGLARLEVSSDRPGLGSRSWTIVGPRLESVTLPRFSGALEPYNIRPTDKVPYVTASWIDTYGAFSYDQVRAANAIAFPSGAQGGSPGQVVRYRETVSPPVP